MNFFTAIEKKSVTVHTSIGDVVISRPTFRQHVLIVQSRGSSDSLVDKALYVHKVLSILVGEKVNKLSINDALSVWFGFDEVFYAPTLPWQEPVDNKNNRNMLIDDNINYDGREIAWIVSLLAYAFSWTTTHILDDLSYSEVVAYVQEAMLENEQVPRKHLLDEDVSQLVDQGY